MHHSSPRIRARVGETIAACALTSRAGQAVGLTRDLRSVLGHAPASVRATAEDAIVGRISADVFADADGRTAAESVMKHQAARARADIERARRAAGLKDGESADPAPRPNARVIIKGRSRNAEFAREGSDELDRALALIENLNATAFSFADLGGGAGVDAVFEINVSITVKSELSLSTFVRSAGEFQASHRNSRVTILRLRDVDGDAGSEIEIEPPDDRGGSGAEKEFVACPCDGESDHVLVGCDVV